VKVVKYWPRLTREAVAATSLAVLKARLDGALSNLGWWKVSLPMAGGLERNDPYGPFQSKPFYDSILQFYELHAFFKNSYSVWFLFTVQGVAYIPLHASCTRRVTQATQR